MVILSRWVQMIEAVVCHLYSPPSSRGVSKEEGDLVCVCVKETLTDHSMLVKG